MDFSFIPLLRGVCRAHKAGQNELILCEIPTEKANVEHRDQMFAVPEGLF